MAKKKKGPTELLGADEFNGPDSTTIAIEKIHAAKEAAATEAEQDRKIGDNGGPIFDGVAWRRAVLEYTAEMLAMEDLEKQKAEIAGRISSIRKIAKKHKVEWHQIKRYYDDHRGIRKGAMGAMVTGERRYRQLLKYMESPLYTQFTLWAIEPEETGEGASTVSAMDAELQGQHAYANNEPLTNNPFDPVTKTELYNDWAHGWKQAQNANARGMGPSDATASV